ncbi:PTS sugar transporter subunit IIB [Calorimonas adulescens]|jgi:PTS system, Lactose/Cellobiose specific IIB subunit.|uniref:PTS sugar transporter subunit IIB n=1 Tax=Calorimonas adulescens TaxID=2606906 RepID=A0A5D8QA23_9THEO|nr:PTS sugar transporter subunit IIB [Calorimonas adulescens]TZE81034.1 PTS sugar transporter subunit IIB [Calorimonas adulescens]
MTKDRVFNVLSICGSGTVSSSMVAEKLKERLSEKGVRINTIEARPTEVANYVSRGGIDFIVTTSPLPGEYDIPVINAVGFLTGFDEEGFMDEVINVISKMQ